jgi:myosin-crossreactive antigen
MIENLKAYLVGGGIGALAAAAFMIRDGKVRADNISILEAEPLLGGSLDGTQIAGHGYSMRGGRMLRRTRKDPTAERHARARLSVFFARPRASEPKLASAV